MRILPINSFSLARPAQQKTAQEQKIPVYNRQLNADTVSFTSGNKMSDCVANSVSKNMDRLNRIATVYLDALESVAAKLKDKGIIFDRVYCERHPVKSPEACSSKIVRSRSFKVPDIIRATLYMNNPYDLSILNDELLPELAKRGYVIPNTEMSVAELKKRGYIPEAGENDHTIKEMPDLDIRLADVIEQRAILAPELRYAISKPQKSGYEDIQMRLVRAYDKKKNPVLHELIILFGPEYSKAKQFESENIYTHLRKFDELNLRKHSMDRNSFLGVVNRYIDLIEKMFRGKISQKLYENAKNKDLYSIADEIPIAFTEDDLSQFEHYFRTLDDKVFWYYQDAKKIIRSKASSQRQLGRESRADREKLQEIHDGLFPIVQEYLPGAKVKKTNGKTRKNTQNKTEKS